ncbi:MAG: carboxypeptidase-like regulatory domain-containing protein, partial [Ignavibacteriaceae bacterium]|nr:carboxypeptidase-like regulatory domain-containing protein [Ignavibacteriaceae bacterium]
MNNFYSLNKRLLTLFLALVLLQAVVFAGTTGKIAGKVLDAKTKEPLIGASVFIEGTSMGAAADVDGNYFVINIPPGNYNIKASTIGYASVEIKSVRVSVDQTTKLDIEMGEQSVQIQTIEVTASRPMVQKDLTSTQTSISGNNISMLPVEDVQSVINLQAGVVDGHFRGGRIGEVKYLIDGVSVNDVYSGEATMQASTNSIQELQVITGTFNAEYGQAMSGIVNQVTKIPEDHYNGSFSAYTGDYLTTRTGLFQYMGKVNPLRTYNVQGSLSGPIPKTNDFIKFFTSARYLNDDGYLYGKRIFNTRDSSDFTANDPNNWHVGATGDGKNVSMNYSRQLTLQGKLAFKVGSGKGIVLEALYQKHDYGQYDHMFIYDPDGNYTYHQNSFLGSMSYTQVFNRSSFLDLLGSIYSTDYKQYTFENPLDSRYVTQDRFSQVSGNALYTGGTQNWYFTHKTKTYTAKADYTSQITNIHEIKAGVEVDLNS